MALTLAFLDHAGTVLADALGRPVSVQRDEPLHGGSINDAYRLVTDAGPFFLKVNQADQFPSLFAAEAKDLRLLRDARALRVPAVLAQGELEGSTYLMLEYVEAAEEGRDFQAGFGRGLARLHRNTHASFGLERNNHIGLLPQVNTPDTDWPRFLVNCRLGPLVRMARDSDRIRPGDVIRFERLYAKLPDLFPPELPALLHGDLWKNNYIAADDGQAVLIDPAAYYGHREMDLAMTRLFGGFDREFYAAYQEEEPLEKGWEERVDLCNLYPLLVHLNLFGGSYAERVGAVLRHYV